MKKLFFFAAVAAALTFAFACTRTAELQTETWTDQVEVPLGLGFDAAFTYSASVEYAVGGVSQAVAEKINAIIVENVFSKDGGSDVPAAGARSRDQEAESYKSQAQEILDEMDSDPTEHAWMFNWSSEVEGCFGTEYKGRSLRTYVVSSSHYMGGAHGMHGISCYVIDMKSGSLVGEEDLFVQGYERTLADLLFQHCMDDLKEEMGDTDPDEIFYAEIAPNGNFSVDEKGVTYYYSPYEIAPYSYGVITIPVSWEELKPILRKH